MEFLHSLVLFLHFLGLASLVGGALVQVMGRGPYRISNAILHGALTQLVTGLILVVLAELGPDPVNHAKVGVKLLVVLVVLTLALLNRKKGDDLSRATFLSILGLSVANVAVAVFW